MSTTQVNKTHANIDTTSLSEALKRHTRQTHDDIDSTVMSKQPFANHENYGKFLQSQYEFHEVLRHMYDDQSLNQKMLGLTERGRAERVIKDMQDLKVEPADNMPSRPSVEGFERIGWLYCAEGSNVGAAILYKHAGKIELDEENGASHLAAHPDGRMRHWRAFKDQLDQLPLTEDEQKQAIEGADKAFSYFKSVLLSAYA